MRRQSHAHRGYEGELDEAIETFLSDLLL